MWYFPIQNTLPSDCLSFFISWTKSFSAVSKTIRILWRRTQLETRSFFTKSNWKWVIILAADTKCPRMALKYITLKKPRGSGLSVARYITLHMQEGANYSLLFVFLAVSLAKLPFHVSARRGDQEKPYCHNRRRRCSWYMESGETKVFRSASRHQLFSGQDLGMFELSLMPCLSERILMCLDDDWISRLLVDRDVCGKNFIHMKVVCIAVSCFRHIGFIQ